MRNRLWITFAATSFLAAGSALAQIIPIVPDNAIDTRLPASHPFEFNAGATFDGVPSILYSNTTETGSRFNPGPGGSPPGSGIQQDVTFDDVAIPNSRLGGATAVDITRITVGIRRAGDAPAVDVNLYWATATTNVTAPDTELDVPFNTIGTASLAPRSAATFITELVTFGDGTNTLFTAPLNNTLFNGFGTFLLGLQFSTANALNGWRITNGVDANANVMWIYDTDVTPSEGAFNFGAGGPNATFYITVEGTAVPEPASASLLAAGASALLLRRRRN